MAIWDRRKHNDLFVLLTIKNQGLTILMEPAWFVKLKYLTPVSSSATYISSVSINVMAAKQSPQHSIIQLYS